MTPPSVNRFKEIVEWCKRLKIDVRLEPWDTGDNADWVILCCGPTLRYALLAFTPISEYDCINILMQLAAHYPDKVKAK